MRRVRTHTFNGRKYKIDIDELEGWCDQFANNDRFIHILGDPNTRNGLITIIHECLHAEDWTKGEAPIERTSKEIGTLLWRLGFRLLEKENE